MEATCRRILYPTDGSALAGAAFGFTLDLALRTGAEVYVLHVTSEATSEPEARDLMIRLRESANAALNDLSVAQRATLSITYEQAEGRHPAPAILAHARQRAIDVVVLATHGRRGLGRLLLGSVAEAVLREAPSPVVVGHAHDAALPARHLVVPVDFSAQSGPALAQAKRLAAAYDATISLLFVAEEHVVPFFSDTGIPTFALKKIDAGILEHAEAAMRQLDAATAGPEVPTTYAVRTGAPAPAILTYARETQAGLLVLARRGHGEAAHGLLGSTTERVVRTASCPVWTLPDAAPAPDPPAPGAAGVRRSAD